MTLSALSHHEVQLGIFPSLKDETRRHFSFVSSTFTEYKMYSKLGSKHVNSYSPTYAAMPEAVIIEIKPQI